MVSKGRDAKDTLKINPSPSRDMAEAEKILLE